jgi:small GTP-binding protein
VRVWDLDGNQPPRVLEGHTDLVSSVALSADGKRAVSGSVDNTVRVWDLDGKQPPRVLEGHTGSVISVALSADGKHAVSSSGDRTLCVWDISVSPQLRVEDAKPLTPAEDRVKYTNAKVVLVGDSGSGKTGITERLAHDLPPERWPSTSGTWSTQWPLRGLPHETGWEREVWLWDFGGQADQRLIHQLYLDRTAVVLLMFDADKETVLPGLFEWRQALARTIAPGVPVLLLAGRTDVSSRFSRDRVQAFARENRYEYIETSAQTGRGLPELRQALVERIPWSELPLHDSPARFKRMKDEILHIRDEGKTVLATFKELESLLANRLPADFRFSSEELKTVISLLDGPGVVKELHYGSYILLRPEWINIYAQAVIRTLRAAESGLGYLPVRSIMEGKLIFQANPAAGQGEAEKRLRPADEQIVLQDMESVLMERRLCLRQEGDLVFPSYCGRERPQGPVQPQYFVSYTMNGFLDDIYATLVVRLAHCGAFKLKDLWRDAADFETLAEKRMVGIRLQRGEDGRGELLAHHAPGVTRQEQVIFANYIHEHLSEKSTTEVARLRHYVCPRCNEPVRNRELAMERLHARGERAEILCQRCEKPISLWDEMEKRFADPALRQEVDALRARESAGFDTRRQGDLLVHEVSARILSANQKCHEIPGSQDEGVDMEVEFTDGEGRGTGKHMYLQLKSGNSHLSKRESDGAEIFTIKKQSWVKYWTSQDGPMMLVIGTFPVAREREAGMEKRVFEEVRWMEIGEPLRKELAGGAETITQIVFKGERLDAQSVLRWRDKALERH